MNAISTFTFHESHNVRVQLIDGEPWFCLRDVCSVLDLDNRSANKFGLDLKGMEKFSTPSNGGTQSLNYVNEPNLYRVIFRSNKVEARKFQDWVFNDVLPTIRKTGKYVAPVPQIHREYLNTDDMHKIKRLVVLCANYVNRKDSFIKAVHYALRKATGVPSPAKYEVQHLPILAQEFQRIFSIVEPYFDARADCENSIIKHLIRENALHPILDEVLTELKKTVDDYTLGKKQQLNLTFNADCLALMNRCSSNLV